MWECIHRDAMTTIGGVCTEFCLLAMGGDWLDTVLWGSPCLRRPGRRLAERAGKPRRPVGLLPRLPERVPKCRSAFLKVFNYTLLREEPGAGDGCLTMLRIFPKFPPSPFPSFPPILHTSWQPRPQATAGFGS